MAKSDIRIEQAHAVIERVAQELGLLVGDTSFGKKIQGPSNKHRIYVQKGQCLGRIDTTLPLEQDDPAYVQLNAPNGSIRCHVRPDLEQLERCLRMLAESSLETQVPNKPRPFAASKAPGARRPKAMATPVPAEALKEVAVDRDRAGLEGRIAAIKAASRSARIRMVLENPEKYGVLSESEAEALVDGRFGANVEIADVAEAARNASLAETNDILEEAGIEVVA